MPSHTHPSFRTRWAERVACRLGTQDEVQVDIGDALAAPGQLTLYDLLIPLSICGRET